jgi:hypothetical protein
MASTGELQPVQRAPSFLEILRQPRVTLALLAAWAIIGVVAEVLSDSFLFDMPKGGASGILGGRVFSASAIIPAIVYIWALRDPQRHRPVFWLALIEQVAVILSSFYHKGADDITWAGAIVPAVISAALIFLIFLNLFQPRAAALPQPAGGPPPTPRQ